MTSLTTACSKSGSPLYKNPHPTGVDTPRLLYRYPPDSHLNGLPTSDLIESSSIIPQPFGQTNPLSTITTDSRCSAQPTPAPPPLPPSPTSSPNCTKTTSGIPRLIPSFIPRPTAPQLTSSISNESFGHAEFNSNNNNGTTVYGGTTHMRSYGEPYGSSASSAILTDQPTVHPFIEPPDLVSNGSHHTRSRALVRYANTNRMDRATSDYSQRALDNESDTSSVFSSSGPPRVIGPKVNSLKNVHHKPAGGNVTIIDEKLKLGPVKSKCNSFANVKHKPGGGNVQIVDAKLDVSNAQPKVNSLKNARHVPSGGQVQIVSEKLEFDKTAKPKVGSLKNAQHRPGGGDVQIFKEALPWLKYNKPNLSEEEKARINKQRSVSHGDMGSSVHSGSTTHTGS